MRSFFSNSVKALDCVVKSKVLSIEYPGNFEKMGLRSLGIFMLSKDYVRSVEYRARFVNKTKSKSRKYLPK
jgi:hypothetical protein